MKEYEHKDLLGQDLEVGDYVVAALNSGLGNVDIYIIQRFDYVRYHHRAESKAIVNLTLKRLGAKNKRVIRRSSVGVVKIDPKLLTFRELKKQVA
jgi:hypothetical protein